VAVTTKQLGHGQIGEGQRHPTQDSGGGVGLWVKVLQQGGRLLEDRRQGPCLGYRLDAEVEPEGADDIKPGMFERRNDERPEEKRHEISVSWGGGAHEVLAQPLGTTRRQQLRELDCLMHQVFRVRLVRQVGENQVGELTLELCLGTAAEITVHGDDLPQGNLRELAHSVREQVRQLVAVSTAPSQHTCEIPERAQARKVGSREDEHRAKSTTVVNDAGHR
jgi:hypothetical protein